MLERERERGVQKVSNRGAKRKMRGRGSDEEEEEDVDVCLLLIDYCLMSDQNGKLTNFEFFLHSPNQFNSFPIFLFYI